MLLDLNDLQSVAEAIQRNKAEIEDAGRGIWPPTSLVPIESRGHYLDTMEASITYLTKRYCWLTSRDYWADFRNKRQK